MSLRSTIALVAFSLAALQACAPSTGNSKDYSSPVPDLGRLGTDRYSAPAERNVVERSVPEPAAARPAEVRSYGLDYCRRCQ